MLFFRPCILHLESWDTSQIGCVARSGYRVALHWPSVFKTMSHTLILTVFSIHVRSHEPPYPRTKVVALPTLLPPLSVGFSVERSWCESTAIHVYSSNTASQ